MTIIELLCHLMTREPIFQLGKYDAGTIEILKSLNLWLHDDIITEIDCDICGNIHFIDDDTYYCPEEGIIEIDDTSPEFALGRISLKNITEHLKSILDVQRSFNSVPSTNTLYPLGTFKFGTSTAWAILNTRLSSLQSQYALETYIEQHIIQKHYKKNIGFVFTAQNHGIIELKNNFWIMPFESVFYFKNTVLNLDMLKLNNLLPAYRKIDITISKPQRGRKTKKDNLKIAISDLIDSGCNLNDIKKNGFQVLIKEYEDKFQDTISIKTCRRVIQENITLLE